MVARSNRRMPIAAMPRPPRPLIAASMTLSISSCLITRQRDAPSDMRTEISRARLVARDSSRLATFAQAISSTNATAPINDRNTVRIGPPFWLSLKVWTRAWMSLLVSGLSDSSFLEMLIELALRLLARHAGREMAERLQLPGVAFLRFEIRDLRERHPQIGVERELEAFRHHADDRRRDVVDANRPADHRRIAAVAVQEHAVADDHHGCRARAIVVGHEVASQYRRGAEDARPLAEMCEPLNRSGGWPSSLTFATVPL